MMKRRLAATVGAVFCLAGSAPAQDIYSSRGYAVRLSGLFESPRTGFPWWGNRLPTVIHDGGLYYAYYAGARTNPDADPTHGGLHLCTSDDGIAFGDCVRQMTCDAAYPGFSCGWNFVSDRPWVSKSGAGYRMWPSFYSTDGWGPKIHHTAADFPENLGGDEWELALGNGMDPEHAWESHRTSASVYERDGSYVAFYLRRMRYPGSQCDGNEYPRDLAYDFVRSESDDGVSWSGEEVVFELGCYREEFRLWHWVFPHDAGGYTDLHSFLRIGYRKSLDSEGRSWGAPVQLPGLSGDATLLAASGAFYPVLGASASGAVESRSPVLGGFLAFFSRRAGRVVAGVTRPAR